MKHTRTICMLVSNDVTSDPRVVKEATTLGRAGYKVTVFGLKSLQKKSVENKIYYKIIRLPKHKPKSVSFVTIAKKYIRHLIFKIPVVKRLSENKYITVRIQMKFRIQLLIRDLITDLKIKNNFLSNIIELCGLLSLLYQRNKIFNHKKTWGFDIYHAHDMDMLLPGYLNARQNRARFVYDAHEIWPYQRPGRNPVTIWVLEQIEKYIMRRTDTVITVNESIAKHFLKRYNLKSKPEIIFNYPPVNSEIKNTAAERRYLLDKFKLPKNAVIGIYQGKFALQRGIEKLIDAARFFTPKLFIIIRGPENEYLQYLKDYALSKKTLNKKIFFDPPVPMPQMIVKASAADIGILNFLPLSLNNYFILPNKLFEYMAAGLAIVSNDLPEVRQVVEHAGSGLLAKGGQPRDIARKLNWLAGNKKLLRKFRENAKAAATNTYNWEKEKQKLLNIYNRFRLGHYS